MPRPGPSPLPLNRRKCRRGRDKTLAERSNLTSQVQSKKRVEKMSSKVHGTAFNREPQPNFFGKGVAFIGIYTEPTVALHAPSSSRES